MLVVASEALPFIKTGGLADVAAALPKDLVRLGADVAVMIPMHRLVKDKYFEQTELVAETTVDLNWRKKYLGIRKLIAASPEPENPEPLSGGRTGTDRSEQSASSTVIGCSQQTPCEQTPPESGPGSPAHAVTTYFIDCEDYFGDAVYRGGDAESEQYLYFCRAVLAAIPLISWIPDVIHCNDWHTGMIPMLLKTQYGLTPLGGIKTVFTIHNIKFQGQMDFGLMSDMLSIPRRYYSSRYVEANGCANMLKAALVFADKITTVSPTYASEIMYAHYGLGMEGVLWSRKRDVSGIVNGIDTEDFDPLHDTALARNFDVDTMRDKWENKKALRKEFALGGSLYSPVICMITRMTAQKGLDLVRYALEELLNTTDASFIMLGSGDHEYEVFFNYIAAKFPDSAGVYLGYNEALARRIYAGSDFLLMPSEFEPCGLSQMIAQRYGSLPIVRETGGLADTVIPYNQFTKEGDGFSFGPFNAHDMLHSIRYALDVYRDKPALRLLKKNAMIKDNSFLSSAKKYLDLYTEIVV
ncbi:MAG: glycogen synthase [Clostridiales Family XIII bacterium]|nr:glycogen synthase [Clostridiales Family XIII bacterium]